MELNSLSFVGLVTALVRSGVRCMGSYRHNSVWYGVYVCVCVARMRVVACSVQTDTITHINILLKATHT